MDPLTHTLVGANLSTTKLGEKTRYAAPALIIGANLPDIDGVCYLIDSDLALWFRRGWTHGVLALIVLPFVLAVALRFYARLRDDGEAIDFRWLTILSAIGIWSHPALDWLNTYGVRLLMPFSGKWFYGDSVYIMDPWLWLALGCGYLAGRRATPGLMIAAAAIGAWTIRAVLRRSPEYLPLLVAVMVILVAALLWRGPLKRPALARMLATMSLVLSFAYIGMRILMSEVTQRNVELFFAANGEIAEQSMVSPDPISPLEWSFVARIDSSYRYGTFHWSTKNVRLHAETVEARPLDAREWQSAKRDPSVRGLVTWLRFPTYEIERSPQGTYVHILDARRSGAGRRGTVLLTKNEK
jgi:inner membrane protein